MDRTQLNARNTPTHVPYLIHTPTHLQKDVLQLNVPVDDATPVAHAHGVSLQANICKVTMCSLATLNLSSSIADWSAGAFVLLCSAVHF